MDEVPRCVRGVLEITVTPSSWRTMVFGVHLRRMSVSTMSIGLFFTTARPIGVKDDKGRRVRPGDEAQVVTQ